MTDSTLKDAFDRAGEIIPECSALGLFEIDRGQLLRHSKCSQEIQRHLEVIAAAASEMLNPQNVALETLSALAEEAQEGQHTPVREILLQLGEVVGLVLRRRDRDDQGVVAIFPSTINVPIMLALLRRGLPNLEELLSAKER